MNLNKPVPIITSILVGFFIGFFARKITQVSSNIFNQEVLKKYDVSLLLDDKGNLIFIDKKNEEIRIYQDSIGMDIFNLYTKKTWNKR